MKTVVREEGTEVHETQPGADRIAAFRRISERKQYAKIDGHMVDLFTASAVVSVYDALNENSQNTFAALPVPRMASVALKLLEKK